MEEKHDGIPIKTDEGNETEKTIDLTQLDADKVLTAFGKYGKYQMTAYFLTNVTWLMFAAEMMVMAFITAEPSFSCKIDDVHDQSFFPKTNKNDTCNVHDVYNNVSHVCGINGTEIVFNSTIGETLVSEFKLVCSDEEWSQTGTSIFMLGSMLATPFLTQMSDRYGRRWAFMLPVWLAVVANIFCALSPNYVTFLILRFLAGVGTAGMSAIGWVLCCESVSLKFRSTIPLCGNITWVAGYLIVGVLAHYITNWRWLYFWLSVPAVLTIIFYWLLPESLHWMITQKDTKGIKRYIDKATKFNKRKIDLEECMTMSKDGDKGQAAKRSIIDIFKSKKLVFHLVLFSYIAIVNDLYYWALALFSVDLSDDRFTGYILSGLVEVPSGLIAIPLLLWLSRRTLSFASLFAQGVFLLCLVFVDKNGAYIPLTYTTSHHIMTHQNQTGQRLFHKTVAIIITGSADAFIPMNEVTQRRFILQGDVFLRIPESPLLALILPLLGKAANIIVWSSVVLILPEMIPTTIRNVFYGIVVFLSNIGSIAAPYIGNLKKVDVRLPPLILGSMSVVAAFCVFFFPETKGVGLPEDLEDLDAGPFLNFMARRKCETEQVVRHKISENKNSISLDTEKVAA